MKKLALIFSLVCLSNFAQAGEIYITVKGMVCSFCAQGIEKNFKSEKSVEKIKVDLANNFVHLLMKDKQDLSDDQINKLIKDAGYNVEKIERSYETKAN